MPRPSLNRASGYFEATGLDGSFQSGETRQCCHCGGTWEYKPGSGNRRGYCPRCDGFTCGHPACGVCVPTEQLLENYEHGRPLDYRPIVVPVSVPTPHRLIVPGEG